MARRSYSREDVETHYGSDRPAVNVKVYDGMREGYAAFCKYEPDHDAGFTLEWIEETFTDEYLDEHFWMTCRFEWEMIEQDAEEVFGKGVKLEQDGRMGGWAVVTSLPDISEWDAVALAKWRRFERLARSIASDVPYQMVSGLYLNEWETRKAERAEEIGHDLPDGAEIAAALA